MDARTTVRGILRPFLRLLRTASFMMCLRELSIIMEMEECKRTKDHAATKRPASREYLINETHDQSTETEVESCCDFSSHSFPAIVNTLLKLEHYVYNCAASIAEVHIR